MTELDDRFVRGVAFCLAYENCRGNVDAARNTAKDYETTAMWALRCSDAPDELEPEISGLSVALVSGGATKIKGYVFESARLPEIRGASGLLDRINLEDMPRLWRKVVGCEDCIIYNNGGEVLGFAPVSQAPKVADAIERIYTEETLVAQSVAVWDKFTLKQLREGLNADHSLSDEDAATFERLLGYNPKKEKSFETFGSLVTSLALAKFRRREGNPHEVVDGVGRQIPLRLVPHLETVPFARRCSSCERRGAVVNARVGDEDRPLCEPCARKRVFGQLAKKDDPSAIEWWTTEDFTWQPGDDLPSWAAQFEMWLQREENQKLRDPYRRDASGESLPDGVEIHAADDLSEIASVSKPEGFFGVIYADGNNMGQLLEELQNPVEYAEFAEYVYYATKDAVFRSLARNLTSKWLRREKIGGLFVHPFEILSIGGDDLFLIVPAHVALPIACDIAKFVEAELMKNPEMFEAKDNGNPITYDWSKVQRCHVQDPATQLQCKVSLSVGVVIADAHTPVFYLEDLAGQLLKSAKRRAKWLKKQRRYYGGTVDFLALKSVSLISGAAEEFRKEALTMGKNRLYARPYTIAELEALLATIKLLKNNDFPRGQVYRLRESLRNGVAQSTADYLYFLSRNKDLQKTRGDIEGIWTPDGDRIAHPWRPQWDNPKEKETIWHDLVELYDFVPVGKGGENAASRD